MEFFFFSWKQEDKGKSGAGELKIEVFSEEEKRFLVITVIQKAPRMFEAVSMRPSSAGAPFSTEENADPSKQDT